MGIIRAAAKSLSSGLADQWLEVIEPSDMGAQTLMTPGIMVNRKSQNRKGSRHVISDGSVIHVYDNQLMILTDGGKIIDYTAEPGYFEVNNATEPSLFNGDFSGAMQATFERVKYGGQSPTEQKVYYLNLQEIKGIKFGTRNPINYFDNFYNAELFLRTHGTYSIRITDPLRFYAEVIPRNMDQVEVSDVNEQFLDEFLEALQSAINQMSADGIRISFVTSKGRELGKYMADILDEEAPDTELPSQIYLFQGLPKGDRMEYIIQKSVELGVYEIIPVAMKYCVVKLDAKKAGNKVKRWQAISESAAKQSKRSRIPEVHAVMNFKDAVEYAKLQDMILVPYENERGMEATREALEKVKPGQSISVFIGPEGGFSEEEIDTLRQDAEVLSLGKRILRTDTAAICAMSMLMLELEEKTEGEC